MCTFPLPDPGVAPGPVVLPPVVGPPVGEPSPPSSPGVVLGDGDGLWSGVTDGLGDGDGLVVSPGVAEAVPVPSGLALAGHGAGEGDACPVRVALALPVAVGEGGGEVVTPLGLRSGLGLGESVCVGLSDGLVTVVPSGGLVVVSVGDPVVAVAVSGLTGGLVGGVVGGVVVWVAVGLAVVVGWPVAAGELHETRAAGLPLPLTATAPGPPAEDWPVPSAVPPPLLEFWPVIAVATWELSEPIPCRTAGTASATPIANTAKPAANAGRSTATCHCLADRGACRAWPPWWDQRRNRSARKPPLTTGPLATASGTCAWAGPELILARILSRPSACGSTWSAAACSDWRTNSPNSRPGSCGPFGRRPNLTITPAPGPNAARSSRAPCGS
jgi:hypothetical protein